MLKAYHHTSVKKIYNKISKYYDLMHKFGTFSLDQKGRKHLVNRIVEDNDLILDAGGGTGTTSMMALKKTGENTKSVILDFSESMLEKAKQKAIANGLEDRISFIIGDMYEIPFPDNHFDTVISTYSTCPLEEPSKAVKEMLRVLKPNGLLGIAHSSEADSKIAKALSNWIEKIIWKFPRLSLGCRSINLMDDIKKMDVNIIENKLIGVIPWYFRLIILEKNPS